MSLNKARKRLIRKYRNIFQMLKTLILEVLVQVNCQLVKLALETLK